MRVVRRLVILVVAMGLSGASSRALVACSSTPSVSGPGADGSSAADGTLAADANADSPPGESADAGHTVDSAGDVDAAEPDGPTTAHTDGATGLDGSMAFGVHYSVVIPQNLQAACGYAPGPSTGYGDVVVVMTDVDVSSGCASGFVSPPPSAAGHPFVRLEVVSPGYGRDGGGLSPDAGPVAALAPGSSAIGFENLTDDDSCMLASLTGGTALLDVLDFGDGGFATPVGTSISGTITLRTVVTGHVAGDFNVLLAPVRGGQIEVDAAAPFGGQFDTTTCPGMTQ